MTFNVFVFLHQQIVEIDAYQVGVKKWGETNKNSVYFSVNLCSYYFWDFWKKGPWSK